MKATYCPAGSDDVCERIVDRVYQTGVVRSYRRVVRDMTTALENLRKEIRQMEDDLRVSKVRAQYYEVLSFCACSELLFLASVIVNLLFCQNKAKINCILVRSLGGRTGSRKFPPSSMGCDRDAADVCRRSSRGLNTTDVYSKLL